MDKLVNRFLSWPLPESVCADLIASKPGEAHRSGTNLLSAIEAKQMLEHVVGDELDRLHAEVASLKEELAATQSVGLRYARENADLTQQLAAANGRVERMREVLHRISLGSRNSMTSKESLGKEARAALDAAISAQENKS